MDAFGRINNYWDIAQQPTTFSTLPDDDFLALLQRQFPTSIGGTPKPLDLPPDGVDPQNISTFTLPSASPESSDSSPSPPSMNDTPDSRPQSGVFSASTDSPSDDPTLKRKASDESMDDEPTQKTQHTNGSNPSRKSSASRRKSTGNSAQAPSKDEFRLLKRKEQNRAAQRAFRERKEKHVKDLEDKVAALEAKNQAAESENGNLRDLLQRLQSENMALKNGDFTFQMSKDGTSGPSNSASPSYSSPAPSGSKSPVSMVPQTPQFNFDFHQLIPFDPANLNVIDEAPQQTATDGAMNMDFGFGGQMPYRTLASNPMYMSFAEPMNMDLTPTQQSPQQPNSIPSPAASMNSMHGLTSFDNWSSPDSLDQLFGGNYMGAQSPVDFAALLSSPPSSISPISHTSLRSNSGTSVAPSPAGPQRTDSSPAITAASSSSSQSTPSATSESSSPSPSLATPATPTNLTEHVGECPKTKDDMRRMVEQRGSSAFVEVPEPQGAAFIRKNTDGQRPLIVCEGSSFPKTQQSEKNIEVLTAWRTITSNPQFKDVDINELCSEFTSKARCDGTKVVLEPEGVHRIMEALAAKRQQQQQGSPRN